MHIFIDLHIDTQIRNGILFNINEGDTIIGNNVDEPGSEISQS